MPVDRDAALKAVGAVAERIGRSVEADPNYAARVHFTATPAEPTTADALAESAGKIANTVKVAAMVCYTSTGSTARRIARERGLFRCW